MGLKEDIASYLRIARVLRPQRGWKVLDVACGEGLMLAALEQMKLDLDVIGSDISETAVKQARINSPNSTVEVGDAEKLTYAEASFDCVTCLGSIENFEDPVKSMAEIRRVLKPHGRFLTLFPNKFWLEDVVNLFKGNDEDVPFQHVERQATLPQWKWFIESNGFDVQRVKGYEKLAPLFKDGKMRSIQKFLWTHFLEYCIPVSLNWGLIYVCRRSEREPDFGTEKTQTPHLWRAEWPNAVLSD